MSDLFLQSDQESGLDPLAITPASQDTDKQGFLSAGQRVSELGKQIDWIFNHRRNEYLEGILSLQNHKSVAIRRKIAKSINKILNFSKDNLVRLENWQKTESDREVFILLESALDKLKRSEFGDDLEQSAKVYTVSEAVSHIKNIIADRDYVIEGEITDPRDFGNAFYFGLKDSEEVRMDCRVFSFNLARVRFPLNEGLSIRVTGKFHLNKQSRLVFDIDKIELTGEGELLRNLQLLEEKLTREGLFDPESKQTPTPYPRKILLIASPNSAALKDFCKVLFARRSGVEVFLLAIKTQGVGAELEILERLSGVNQLCTEYDIDTIVMTRGGGSKDDLAVFNSERIVRALFNLIRPIIVAIGHEQDFTLSEKVADLRASTPSNAAELVSLSDYQIRLAVQSRLQSITSASTGRLQSYKDWKTARLSDIHEQVSAYVAGARQTTEAINLPILNLVRQIRLQSSQFTAASLQHINLSAQRYKIDCQSSLDAIVYSVRDYLQTTKYQLELLNSKTESLSPKKVLSLGYAIIRQEDRVITSRTQINKDTALEVEFYDGKVEV